jgi:hypothetical protein
MKTIWILVYTVGGILEKPEIFFSKKKAVTRRKELKSGNSLKEYDEVGIFSKRLSIAA